MKSKKQMRAARPARASAPTKATVRITPRILAKLAKFRDLLREQKRKDAERERARRAKDDKAWTEAFARQAPNVKAFHAWAKTRPACEDWTRPGSIARLCRVPEEVVVAVAAAGKGAYYDFGFDPKPIWRGRHVRDLRRVLVARFDRHVRALRRAQAVAA